MQRAATRLRDGVLEEARRAAGALVDDAATNCNGSITVRAADDVRVGVGVDDLAVRRHREVVEAQRGVEELGSVISPLVGEQPTDQMDMAPVRTPPDAWTSADAFAEVYR